MILMYKALSICITKNIFLNSVILSLFLSLLSFPYTIPYKKAEIKGKTDKNNRADSSHLYIVKEYSTARQWLGKHRLKDGIVEPEQTSIAEQRLCNHVRAARNSNEQVGPR
jgi:hypothetical protein